MKNAKGLRAAFIEFFGLTSERELRDINVNTCLDDEKNKGKRVVKEFFGLTSEREVQAVEVDEDDE